MSGRPLCTSTAPAVCSLVKPPDADAFRSSSVRRARGPGLPSPPRWGAGRIRGGRAQMLPRPLVIELPTTEKRGEEGVTGVVRELERWGSRRPGIRRL